jgi:hypothetical protein
MDATFRRWSYLSLVVSSRIGFDMQATVSYLVAIREFQQGMLVDQVPV